MIITKEEKQILIIAFAVMVIVLPFSANNDDRFPNPSSKFPVMYYDLPHGYDCSYGWNEEGEYDNLLVHCTVCEIPIEDAEEIEIVFPDGTVGKVIFGSVEPIFNVGDNMMAINNVYLDENYEPTIAGSKELRWIVSQHEGSVRLQWYRYYLKGESVATLLNGEEITLMW